MDYFSEVLVIAQQLRRKIPGGIGTYTQGLLFGLSEIKTNRKIKISIFATQGPKVQKDPLSRYGFNRKTVPLPAKVITTLYNQRLVGPPR